MLVTTDIKKFAPSVYAEQPDDKVSKEKYTFIPTSQIVGDLSKLGWNVHSAVQQKVRDKSKIDTTKHMLTFRNPEFKVNNVGDEIPQILLVNSHDRTSSFKFHVGIHRLVCSNGMVVASSTLRDLKLRHMHGNFKDIQELVNKMTTEIPLIFNQIDAMKHIGVTFDQKMDFANAAIALRFTEYQNMFGDPLTEKIKLDVDLDDFISPLRKEDRDSNLWNLLNITQEKLTKGGFLKQSEKSRIHTQKRLEAGKASIADRMVRPISNIRKHIDMNKDLWTLGVRFSTRLN